MDVGGNECRLRPFDCAAARTLSLPMSSCLLDVLNRGSWWKEVVFGVARLARVGDLRRKVGQGRSCFQAKDLGRERVVREETLE